MTGNTELSTLLREMKPMLRDGEFVFCTVPGSFSEIVPLSPEGCFWETEGLSVILHRRVADTEGLPYEGTYRLITLSIHSSLKAVGFLAEVSRALAANGVSVNPVAAYYHDHLFVPSDQARKAMGVLKALSEKADSEGGG
jgi:hypothetical protein